MTTLDEAEVHRLIEEHLPLVKHIVFQVAVHFPRHVERDELAPAGALGLVEAARRYDESRGVPFDRFAAQRIRGAILDAVRAADWAPRSVRILARKLEQVEQRLATQLGRVPNARRDGRGARHEPRRARAACRTACSARSCWPSSTRSATTDEELTLVDVLADDRTSRALEELETRELHAYLRDAVALLPERHRLVIVGYFLEGQTSQDLARFLGVTESRVSQLRSEALTMLKDGIEAQYEPSSDDGARPGASPVARPGTPRPSPAPATGPIASTAMPLH